MSETRQSFPEAHVVPLLRLTGLVSVVSGLVGGFIWLVDLDDRSDGDHLARGHFHNPFMRFRIFDETFLDISLWVLFACSAAVGLGGLMLLVPSKWGVPLVTWQARVSIITHGVIAFFIFAMTFGFGMMPWEKKAFALRLGAVALDLTLWTFLSGNAVRGFFARQSQRPERSFEVVMQDPKPAPPGG